MVFADPLIHRATKSFATNHEQESEPSGSLRKIVGLASRVDLLLLGEKSSDLQNLAVKVSGTTLMGSGCKISIKNIIGVLK